MKRSFFDVQCGERPHTATPCERRLIAAEFAKVLGAITVLFPLIALALAALPG